MANLEESIGVYFKPDVKAAGSKLLAQEKVQVSSGSETTVQAYVKVAPPLRVRLTSEGVASESFDADCNCPVAKKDRLCKHIWATLLAVEERYPDFLSAKRTIEKLHAEPTAASAIQEERKAAAKAKASEYRKAQYQRLKARAKERKQQERERAEPAPTALNVEVQSPEVQAAITYFEQNGFSLLPCPTEESIGEAKRKLSRVFHPDRGGSHEEVVELNRHSEVLLQLLRGY